MNGRMRDRGISEAQAAAGITFPKTRIMSTELNIVGGNIVLEYRLGPKAFPEVVVPPSPQTIHAHIGSACGNCPITDHRQENPCDNTRH